MHYTLQFLGIRYGENVIFGQEWDLMFLCPCKKIEVSFKQFGAKMSKFEILKYLDCAAMHKYGLILYTQQSHPYNATSFGNFMIFFTTKNILPSLLY